jgi:hypothetical protein
LVVMTNEEVSEYFTRSSFSGIKLRKDGEQKLYYDDEEADCIELDFPETPGWAAYFARAAALLGTDFDESIFTARCCGLLFTISAALSSKRLVGSKLN